MKITPLNIAKVGVVLIILCGLSVLIGYRAGNSASSVNKERLSLLWPDVMALQERDRALLVKLSFECHLERQPVEVIAVTTCLREGAKSLEERDASTAAVRRLEDLLPGVRA